MKFSAQQGFSIPELLLIMSIMTTLIGFATLNLIHAQNATTLTSVTDSLISDMKNQQIKAMESATEGRATSDNYGIHFTPTQYILFHGSSYNANDTSNLTITINGGVTFTNDTLPSQNIIFTQGNGEITGFNPSGNTITIKTVSGSQQKIITVNQYGVVAQVQ